MELTDRERVIQTAIIQGGYIGDKIVLLVSRDAPSNSRVYLFERIARTIGYYVEVMPYEGLTNVKGKNCLVDAIKKYYSHRLVEPRFSSEQKVKKVLQYVCFV